MGLFDKLFGKQQDYDKSENSSISAQKLEHGQPQKVFEDYFSELQADMVSICLEYVAKRADVIYIYCSYEGRTITCQHFYNINGHIAENHKLNDFALDDYSYDVSLKRITSVAKILTEDMQKITDLCKEYGREAPTEIKLLYDVRKNSLSAACRYDQIYSNDSVKTAHDVIAEWFDEISKNNTLNSKLSTT
ncbi:hypothetical protein ACYULU_03115 [Breznakiellaceae bacterium SP9]